jgi:hypothetical protein
MSNQYTSNPKFPDIPASSKPHARPSADVHSLFERKQAARSNAAARGCDPELVDRKLVKLLRVVRW